MGGESVTFAGSTLSVQCQRNELGTTVKSCTCEHVLDVLGHGSLADRQPLGDLGCAESFRQEVKYLGFPRAYQVTANQSWTSFGTPDKDSDKIAGVSFTLPGTQFAKQVGRLGGCCERIVSPALDVECLR